MPSELFPNYLVTVCSSTVLVRTLPYVFPVYPSLLALSFSCTDLVSFVFIFTSTYCFFQQSPYFQQVLPSTIPSGLATCGPFTASDIIAVVGGDYSGNFGRIYYSGFSNSTVYIFNHDGVYPKEDDGTPVRRFLSNKNLANQEKYRLSQLHHVNDPGSATTTLFFVIM